MAPRQRTASKDKPEQRAEPQQDDETPAPTPQELEKLRWRQYRIIASIVITLAAVMASRLHYISPQYGLGIIIMLYVTQRFTL
jgi:hypothetical protein